MAVAKKLPNLGFARVGMLPAATFARDVAGQCVQIQGDLQPLRARQLTVAFDLLVRCRCRSHDLLITQAPQKNDPNTDGISLTTTRRLKLRLRSSASSSSSEPLGLSRMWHTSA